MSEGVGRALRRGITCCGGTQVGLLGTPKNSMEKPDIVSPGE